MTDNALRRQQRQPNATVSTSDGIDVNFNETRLALQTSQCFVQPTNFHVHSNAYTSDALLFDFSFNSHNNDSFNLLDLEPLPIACKNVYSIDDEGGGMDSFIGPPPLPTTLCHAPCSFPFPPTYTKSSYEDADRFHQLKMAMVQSGIPQPLLPQQQPLVSVSPIPSPFSTGGSTQTNVTAALSTLSSPQQYPKATPTSRRSRKLQPSQWNARFHDLLKFQKDHGHLFVPNNYTPNPSLSQWVKRNRYQYKLKQAGKRSTVSDEREAALNAIGFVWDSHASSWQQRLQELKQFVKEHGHCNIPNTYHDASLSLWCKHQRRQYNRLRNALSSTMTQERFRALQALGFDWNPRNLKQKVKSKQRLR